MVLPFNNGVLFWAKASVVYWIYCSKHYNVQIPKIFNYSRMKHFIAFCFRLKAVKLSLQLLPSSAGSVTWPTFFM